MGRLANGRFIGLSNEEKAAAIFGCLSVDREVSLSELLSKTGLTPSQIHEGMRYLREVKPQCVVTYRRGPGSCYKLAEDAPEVRDYALRRMRLWRSQVTVMHAEMRAAMQLLPGGDALKVKKMAEVLTALLGMFELDEKQHQELRKREQVIERREKQLTARR